ncbi:hypothetical protein OSTOST_04087 [Ostertagia ostertagi]
MDPTHSECPVCHKGIVKRNLVSHMKDVHDISPTTAKGMLAQRKKTELESQGKQEKLSEHCGLEHSEEGALGRMQDYTVHKLSFPNPEEYKSCWHRKEKKDCRRGKCSKVQQFIEGELEHRISLRFMTILSSNERSMNESRQRVPQVGWDPRSEGRILEVVALPCDVVPYAGKDKEYPFEHFVEAFELKYPGQYWEDKERCALFRSKLAGKARAQFEALAKAKKRNFYTLVNAMERNV